MNVLQSVVTRHWNDRAASYQFNMNQDFMAERTYARWKRIITGLIGDQKGLTVLDAGCGTGVISHILCTLGSHRITAADISEAMIRQARMNLAQWNGEFDFLCHDVADLPLPDGRFDLIISRYVIWTLPDPGKALAEWHRLLKPGGRLAVIDGNWYRAYYRSGLVRLWMNAVQLYYKKRSGNSSSQKLATRYVRDLPQTHLLRPDWDIGLLNGLGFKNIRAHRGLERTVHGRTVKRLLSPFSGQFLIQAEKP